tara:strand:- start:3471 stop:6164 length:2694 start_codon:yes stop_codon:yes gene_type:complete
MTDNTTSETDHVVTPLHKPSTSGPIIAAQDNGRQAWLLRFWPLLASMTCSLMWITACVWWFIESEKTLSRMPVYEAGGLLAGASLPLILIWLIALVYLRTDPLRDHRTALVHGLDGLLAPLDVAQRRVNAIVADLHKEISHVEAAGDIATTRIDNLEKRFQDQISNLFEVTTDAEAKAANLQTTLKAERDAFATLVAEASEHITELETMFKQLKFDSESISNTTRKNSEELSNEITFQNKTLDERSRLIEDRLEKMAAGLINMSREMAENFTTSEHDLTRMSDTIAAKQVALTNSLRDVAEQTSELCTRLDQQTQTLAEARDKAAESSATIASSLTDQATVLSTVAEDALNKTRQSGENFRLQANDMETVLVAATQKSKSLLDEASQTFRENAENIVSSSQQLSENLIGHMGRATEDLYARSETLEHTVTARVTSVESALDHQAEIIRTKLIEQSDALHASLDDHAGKAHAFISHQSDSFAQTMDQQFTSLMENLARKTDGLNILAEETTGQLEKTVAAIEAQATRVDTAVQETAQALDDKTDLMKNHYGAFEQMSEQFRLQIDQSEGQLKAQHDDLVKSITDVASHLEEALGKLKDESGSLGEHAQGIISSIVAQTEQLSDRIEDVRGRTENTIRNIQEMGDTVTTHFTSTDQQAAALSENWLSTAARVEQQCTDTLVRLDTLTEKLALLEQENAKATAAAESSATKVADHMQHASESIFLASASAVEAADETNHAIDQHAEKFQQMINALQLSNKSILIDAEAIEQKIREKSGNHFSGLASKIIEQLQSLSIDINRYVEEDVPDKVWQSYVDGDRNAFLRRLKKITDKKHSATIQEKYKNDPEFRSYALEYMQIFEDLMSQSMASDSYSNFSVALISSETGKVYLALAQAVDRFS